MKVIIAKTQKIIKVADGYAFNYLFPRGLAVPADDKHLKKLKQQEQNKLKMKAKQAKQHAKLAKQFDKQTFEFAVDGNQETGQLHQTITRSKLAKLLAIDKKHIDFDKPFKKPGEYKIRLRFADKVANIKIRITIKK